MIFILYIRPKSDFSCVMNRFWRSTFAFFSIVFAIIAVMAIGWAEPLDGPTRIFRIFLFGCCMSLALWAGKIAVTGRE